AAAQRPLLRRQGLHADIERMQAKVRDHQKAQAAEEAAAVIDVAKQLLADAASAGDTRVIVGEVPQAPTEKLREAVDWLRQKSGSAAVLLFSPSGAKVTLLAALTKDVVDGGLSAKAILGEAGKIVGGGGGGRPELAQGGGKKPEKVGEATEHVRAWLLEQLGA
ncbi:MAG: DHHA1 domain-containing protein, partial [Acidobacteriota bacterium]